MQEKVYLKEDIKRELNFTSDKHFHTLKRRGVIVPPRDNRFPPEWTKKQLQEIKQNHKKLLAGEWKNE